MPKIFILGEWSPFDEDECVENLNKNSKYYKDVIAVKSRSIGFGLYAFDIDYSNANFRSTSKQKISKAY